VRVPKLGLLLSQKFGHSYLSQIKFILRMQGKYFIALKRSFQWCIAHPIWPHLTPDFKGFVIGSQIPNLTSAPSFDHNSCKLALNEQCKSILIIYASRPFWGCPRGLIWWFFSLPTKALNIRNSHTSATPKWECTWESLGFIPCTLPHLWECVSHLNTFMASWALALHI